MLGDWGFAATSLTQEFYTRGFACDMRVLRAKHFGARTSRMRGFIIARQFEGFGISAAEAFTWCSHVFDLVMQLKIEP